MEKFIFDGNWALEYRFDAFVGLLSRRGAYTSKSSDLPSDGMVNLTIIDDTGESPDPKPEQINAINYLIENANKIKESMLNGIESIYLQLKEDYCYKENNVESQEAFPKIENQSDFEKVFGVSQ